MTPIPKRQPNETQQQRQARLLKTIRRRFASPAAAPHSTGLLRPIGRADAGVFNFLSGADRRAIMIPVVVEIR